MKKIQVILVATLAVVALAAGGYLMIQRQTAASALSETPPGTLVPSAIIPPKSYSNGSYGIRFDYPGILSPVTEGPNSAELAIQNGVQISGTVPPLLDTVSFQDPSGNEHFSLQVFPAASDAEISEKAYRPGSLSLGTPCDTRYSDAYSAPQFGSASFVKPPVLSVTLTSADASKGGVVCYFLKSLKANLVVLSAVPQENSPVPVTSGFSDAAANLRKTVESLKFFPPPVTAGTFPSRKISDLMVRNAIEKNIGAKLIPSGGAYLGDIPGGMHYALGKIEKADLNGDGYEDAAVRSTYCGASCGNDISIYLNNGDGTASLLDSDIPGYITAGANQAALKSFSVDGPILSITASNWEGGDSRIEETRKFRLQDGSIVPVYLSAGFRK